MTAPHDRPDADGDPTLESRPTPASLDDLQPTIANNPGGANRTAPYAFLAPPVAADEIGRLGHFRVLSLLGAGGMGMVFLSEDMTLGRQVALKVMKPRDDDQDQAGQRFLKEARAIAKIKHDNLVTIYQVGQEGATCFYAMELLAGETLESRIKRGKRWQLTEILRIGQELARGLAAMHENGLIHRDIKPSNIWLEARDERQGTRGEGKGSIMLAPRPSPLISRVKILDFGLVRDVKDDIALTETGIVLGTPAFMSPEQVRGKKVDARTDLYSFGCILYRLCTGQYPHQADNSMAQLAAVVADEPEPVSALNPEIPPVLARLVMQLLAKNPDDRPGSAAVVADRLSKMTARDKDAFDSGSSLDLSYNTSELKRQPSFWHRHGRKILVLAGAAFGVLALGMAAVLLLALALTMGRPEQKKKPPPPPQVKEVEKQFLSQMNPVLVMKATLKKKDKDKDKDKGKDKDKKPPKDLEFEPIFVNGELAPHGIFMHAAHPSPFEPAASLSYQLDKKFQTFSTKVSLSDSSFGTKSPLIFTVYGDGKQLWLSKNVRTAADTQEITLDVKDVTILKLQVAVDGEDIGGAHGAWIEPHLTRR